MRILSAIQALIALAFILFGLVALFGIGITGLLFLIPGAVFAATAGIAQEGSRAAAFAALAADGVLGYFAARKLMTLFAGDTTSATMAAVAQPGLVDYLLPSAVLVLVGVAVIAVALDSRALRSAPWF
jgi:hypothetical protein